jgi:hypothetical protein
MDVTSAIGPAEHDETTSPHSREVDLALILARVISAVKEDPIQLRHAVYELARTKLRSDISLADDQESAHSLAALEIAIRAVEQFSSQSDRNEQPQFVKPTGGEIGLGSSAGPAPMSTVEINEVSDTAENIPRLRPFGLTPAPPIVWPHRRLIATLGRATTSGPHEKDRIM